MDLFNVDCDSLVAGGIWRSGRSRLRGIRHRLIGSVADGRCVRGLACRQRLHVVSHHVIVSCIVFHPIVDTSSTRDGNLANELAIVTVHDFLRNVRFLAPEQAISSRVLRRIDPRGAGFPAKGHRMFSRRILWNRRGVKLSGWATQCPRLRGRLSRSGGLAIFRRTIELEVRVQLKGSLRVGGPRKRQDGGHKQDRDLRQQSKCGRVDHHLCCVTLKYSLAINDNKASVG